VIRRGIEKNTAVPGAGIEVGEKRRNTRRPCQQAGDIAIRAGVISFLERDVPV
jgi:hypothetical protein